MGSKSFKQVRLELIFFAPNPINLMIFLPFPFEKRYALFGSLEILGENCDD
jgi:hypothetical protein